MAKLTPKQQLVMYALEQLGKASVAQLSKVINTDHKATFAHLKRLHKLKLIHVCDWGKSSSGHPYKVYQYGAGVDAALDRQAHYDLIRQATAEKKFIKRNTYNPEAPIVPNTGWVSTIHSWDRTVSQHDHIEFMKRFQPHPDHAATWLFNEPRVELLGARYES